MATAWLHSSITPAAPIAKPMKSMAGYGLFPRAISPPGKSLPTTTTFTMAKPLTKLPVLVDQKIAAEACLLRKRLSGSSGLGRLRRKRRRNWPVRVDGLGVRFLLEGLNCLLLAF